MAIFLGVTREFPEIVTSTGAKILVKFQPFSSALVILKVPKGVFVKGCFLAFDLLRGEAPSALSRF